MATTLLENGCPIGHIRVLLGHAHLATTCKYYLGMMSDAEAKAAHAKFLHLRTESKGEKMSGHTPWSEIKHKKMNDLNLNDPDHYNLAPVTGEGYCNRCAELEDEILGHEHRLIKPLERITHSPNLIESGRERVNTLADNQTFRRPEAAGGTVFRVVVTGLIADARNKCGTPDYQPP